MSTQKIQIAIRADAGQVWDALTNGKITPAYYYGFAEFDLTAGRPYRYTAGGVDMITGSVLAVEPGRSLSTTFRGAWDPAVAQLPESTVTVTLSDPPMPALRPPGSRTRPVLARCRPRARTGSVREPGGSAAGVAVTDARFGVDTCEVAFGVAEIIVERVG